MSPLLTHVLAFVVAVRTLIGITAMGIAYPISAVLTRLPSTDGPSIPRLAKLRAWLWNQIRVETPAYVEYRGSGTIILKTTSGFDTLDRIVDRVPKSIISAWERFGIGTMAVLLVLWGIALLAGMFFWFQTTLEVAHSAVSFLVEFDWSLSYETEAQTNPQLPNLGEVGAALGMIAVALLKFTAVWYAIVLLLLLPGLALHEFGHYTAIRNAGASVDSYGIMLFGPFPIGAFVDPYDDVEDLAPRAKYKMWSAGIANSLLWGSLLLVVGLTFATDPIQIAAGVFSAEFGVLLSQPVASVCLALGYFEIVNCGFNAFPFGAVDGGGFIRAAEEELWGLDESLSPDERVRQLYTLRFGRKA